MELFLDSQLFRGVTAIEDPTHVRMFLAVGSERVALIDTGTGLGDIAAHVRTLTDKPLTVICTHGHIDHAGGASRFSGVYLPQADFELEGRHCTTEMKLKQNKLLEFEGRPTVPEWQIAPPRTEPFIPLEDGKRFELGGLTLRACAFPGHTRGMTAVLFEQLRVMLLGDGCNGRVFLFGSEALSVEEYRSSIKAFEEKHAGEFDFSLMSHGPQAVVSPSILGDTERLCGEIMAGTDDRAPFCFMDEHATVARRLAPDGSHGGGDANIVYDVKRIFAR